MFLDYTAPTPLKHIPDPLPEGMPGVFRMIERAENTNLQVMTALCGLAGLRISEAIAMSSDFIDWHEGLLIVRGKGDKTRPVPMGDRLREILLEPAIRQLNRPTIIEVNGAPIGDRLARRSITRLGRRARITGNVHSHQLRATYATHLHDIGVPIRVIQELLGHADVKTTEGYTAVMLTGMRNAVKGL